MRRLLTIIFGAAFAVALLAPTTDARAQAPPVRVQLVIQQVHVVDDSDALTGGELTYRFRLQRGSPSCPGFWCTGPDDDLWLSVSMSASSGDVRGINKMLGGSQGMALQPGDSVRVGLAGVEEDWDGITPLYCPLPDGVWLFFDDHMCGAHDQLGVLHRAFGASENFGIGQHSQAVRRGRDETFRVDFLIRTPPTTTPAPAPTTRPTPRPTPRPDPGTPPRHEP
jgi:hypothetical protein